MMMMMMISIGLNQNQRRPAWAHHLSLDISWPYLSFLSCDDLNDRRQYSISSDYLVSRDVSATQQFSIGKKGYIDMHFPPCRPHSASILLVKGVGFLSCFFYFYTLFLGAGHIVVRH
jgi:hypothetical protein